MSEGKIVIQRYIEDVLRRLPEKQRDELEIEIKTLIMDTIEEQKVDEDNLEQVKKILIQLGNPQKLAEEYQDKEKYLIGPDHYEKYVWVLKIVLAASIVGLLIANFILLIVEDSRNFMNSFYYFISNAITGSIIAFGITTLIFACIERGKIVKQKEKEWSIEDLPKLSSQKSKIKKGSVLAGIIFTILVIILFNFAPQLMGINRIENGKLISSPIFNLELLKTVIPLFNIAMLLGIIREIAKLVVGKYTKKLAILILILNVIAMIICSILFTQPDLISSNYAESIIQITEVNKVEDLAIIENLFNNFSTFFLSVLGLAFTLDTAEAIYRAFKYDK